ncbi:hypothetical protein M9C64_29410, partial [Pseudomonas aeruginosa]|nr:hypothetical protein [Pseudomonas aeruginosa]
LLHSHYDTPQLTLIGILWLDSISLGHIAADQIDADTWTFVLTGRYNRNHRWQVAINAPAVYRESTYQSAGPGGSASQITEKWLSGYAPLGDGIVGVGYRFHD